MNSTSFFKFLAIVFLGVLSLVCCKQPTTPPKITAANNGVKYATGFTISEVENHTVISIVDSSNDSKKRLRYALIEKDVSVKNPENYDAVIRVPVQKIVVT